MSATTGPVLYLRCLLIGELFTLIQNLFTLTLHGDFKHMRLSLPANV